MSNILDEKISDLQTRISKLEGLMDGMKMLLDLLLKQALKNSNSVLLKELKKSSRESSNDLA